MKHIHLIISMTYAWTEYFPGMVVIGVSIKKGLCDSGLFSRGSARRDVGLDARMIKGNGEQSSFPCSSLWH